MDGYMDIASQTLSRGLTSKTRIEGGREGGKKRWMVRRWEGRGKEEMDGQEVGGKGERRDGWSGGGREGGKKRWMVRRWEGRGKEEMDGQEVGGKGERRDGWSGGGREGGKDGGNGGGERRDDYM